MVDLSLNSASSLDATIDRTLLEQIVMESVNVVVNDQGSKSTLTRLGDLDVEFLILN